MGPHLNTLPVDLLQCIADFLESGDILRLGATSKSLLPLSRSLLESKRHTLYLHPKTVHHAIDFCSQATWTEDIQEVIILGSSEPRMRTCFSGVPDVRLNVRPWPQFLPTENGDEQVLSYQDLVQAQQNSLQKNYASLLDGLNRLPHLQTVKYAGTATRPGLCCVSDQTIHQHGTSKDHWETSFGGEGQPSLRHALRTIWWSDAQVFSAILDTLAGKVHSVHLEQPMPNVSKHIFHNTDDDPAAGPRPRFEKLMHAQNLTHLSFVGPGMNGWYSFLEELTLELPALKTLQIDLGSENDKNSMKYFDPHNFARSNLWEQENADEPFSFNNMAPSCKLESLTVRCHSKLPLVLDSKDASHFIELHRKYLRHVHLSNVVFMARPDVSARLERPPLKGMRDVIEDFKQMKDSGSLESAVLTVTPVGCVTKCQVDSGGTHDSLCGTIPISGDKRVNVQLLHDLAAEYGIPLGNDRWDFLQLGT